VEQHRARDENCTLISPDVLTTILVECVRPAQGGPSWARMVGKWESWKGGNGRRFGIGEKIAARMTARCQPHCLGTPYLLQVAQIGAHELQVARYLSAGTKQQRGEMIFSPKMSSELQTPLLQ
jgi:hypothetical protein